MIELPHNPLFLIKCLSVTSAAQKQSQALLLLDAFLEHCIHPRSLLSPMDADFCAQFIKILHTQGTPGFHTLACYDKVTHILVVNEKTWHKTFTDFKWSNQSNFVFMQRVWSAELWLVAYLITDGCHHFQLSYRSFSARGAIRSPQMALRRANLHSR